MKWVAPALPPVDLVSAQAKLDAACYGMGAVKEHVLDYLASWEWLRQHDGTARPGKVLCMVGPPGVGKTAIAEVVSEVMGRTLIRMPMGGVDDVFLIGADQAYQRGRPGEIARRIRESGRHPSELVFLLDEIDKVPERTTSAVPVLLALLDREQQAHFRDHFLDAVNIDLSKSLFICTATTWPTSRRHCSIACNHWCCRHTAERNTFSSPPRTYFLGSADSAWGRRSSIAFHRRSASAASAARMKSSTYPTAAGEHSLLRPLRISNAHSILTPGCVNLRRSTCETTCCFRGATLMAGADQ